MKKQSIMLSFITVIFVYFLFPLVSFTAEYTYVTNGGDNTVSVIDSALNTVIDTISVGNSPAGITVNPAGSRAYVANGNDHTVSVIDTTTNTVISTIAVGYKPDGITINPAGSLVYVVNNQSNTVSVIDTAYNTVSATIAIGSEPWGITVNPSGNHVYATNEMDDTVSVIDAVNNTVIDTIPVGNGPLGIAVNLTGTEVYVANELDNTISVIDTATNTVIITIPDVGGTGIAVNPAGTEVWVANGDNVVIISNHSVIHTITVGGGVDGIAFNHTGTRAYAAQEYNNTVSVIDTAIRVVIDTIEVGITPFWVAVAQISCPVPNIKANGSDGPVTINQGDLLTVTVSLDPGSHDGEDADWWIAATSPFGLYWFTVNSGWVRSDAPIRVYGGPLFSLSHYTVLDMSTLPVGDYTFYFGVDDNIDGNLDATYVDSLLVTIQ